MPGRRISPRRSATEHALLQKRIEDALPDLLQAEPDVQRRALIYSFTQQFAGLRDVLGSSWSTLFSESKFAAPPLLRGVYFTSGTQEGTPFDRVLGSIQRRFGVEARVQAATAAAGTGKSYFLRGLLQNLVFAEAHLVSRNPARDRRMRIIQIAGIAICAIALVGASVAWFVSYSNNRALSGRGRAQGRGAGQGSPGDAQHDRRRPCGAPADPERSPQPGAERALRRQQAARCPTASVSTRAPRSHRQRIPPTTG